MTPSVDPSRRCILAISLAVAGACAVVLLATSPGLPMVWDEGNAINRAAGIADGDWQYTTVCEGHPAMYGIVIAAGSWAAGGWLAPLDAARFGPIVLFAIAAGAMFYRMARAYSLVEAAAAVAALMLLPRMFAHAHFASIDGPLTSCWILAWATFAPAAKGRDEHSTAGLWLMAVAWGVALGMTLSAKATGWVAPLPFLLWTIIYRDRDAAKTLAVGLPVGLLVFLTLNPPLWSAPIDGLRTFLHLNFHRAANPGLNIANQFFGRMYDLHHPLPWYNTLVWVAISVPLGILVLLGVGVASALRRWRVDRMGTLLVLNWLALLVVRALPGTPPHDGVRLFLPSFAFLAALAGVGCGVVVRWSVARWADDVRRRTAALAVLVLVYVTSTVNLIVYAPQWLSYYNLLIGGLPGATALGMEPTYYWDGLDRVALDWLHENTRSNQKIRFAATSPENLALMQQWGTLRRATAPGASGAYRWYVLQRRPSGCYPVDQWLIDHATPVWNNTLLGVPLVEVYDESAYREAVGRVRETHR